MPMGKRACFSENVKAQSDGAADGRGVILLQEEPSMRAGIMGEELNALSESPVIRGIAQKEPAVPSSHGRGPMGRGGIVSVLPVLESS